MNAINATLNPSDDQVFTDTQSIPLSNFEAERLKHRQAAIDYIKLVIPNWQDLIISDVEEDSIHFCGYSGGVDSSVTGLCLALFNPNLNLIGIMTDTGDEPISVPEILDTIEYLTGHKIVVIQDDSLYGRIEENGYLPSPKSRWCTKVLKIDPWIKYITNNFLSSVSEEGGRKVYAYAGIRYDERDRSGIVDIDGIETIHPLIRAKVNREQVCDIAAQFNVLGSTYYRGRSRSGCESCMYQTYQEWISLLIWNRKKYFKAASVEKVPQPILDRYKYDDSFCVKDMGFYTLYPISSIVRDEKSSFEVNTIFNTVERQDDKGKITWDYKPKPPTKKKKEKAKTGTAEVQFDLLGGLPVEEDISPVEVEPIEVIKGSNIIIEDEVTLYVAVEHYRNKLMNMIGNDELNSIWQSRLISYSTAVSGLTKQLHGYSYHRAMASRTAWDSVEQYDEESHISILMIKFPKGIIPKVDYQSFEKVFTWKYGRSLVEQAHIVSWINRVCDLERSKEIVRLSKVNKRRTQLTKMCEKTVANHVAAGSPNFGTVIGVGHYRPKVIEERSIDDSYDEDQNSVRCFMCSM
ncbi:hypothetical protein A1QO_04095 [Vibrio genomosp. F10 str. ZF-129]|uniref:Phosphoadenosine phosphosulphate reductase domain-containing protein n=1 Tax=Vibrio genomosp. F10 str. ZF-129 TaxID=1187848 RepID=A0A1E5BIR8_9VIBR|nr:hypothetical protein [Vibrio genomosp. F10]OEE37293.1 hypothetical protein A1QO_04095 [Vibrio genomosp. F10 str. ZF-129]